MADQRQGGIAWTQETWNPIRGCSKVSEGCRNCYALDMAARFCRPGQPYEGLVELPGVEADGFPRKTHRWAGMVRLVPEHLEDPLRWRRPRRVFVNSMADLFHESLSFEQIDRIFGVMASACHHTFQVLTKRAARMAEYLDQDRRALWAQAGANGNDQVFDRIHLGARGLPNVWLGVSVENQRAADERIPLLLQAPAAVRWISAEPLLGPVLLDNGESSWFSCSGAEGREAGVDCCESFSVFGHHFHGIDWVVCGGESGPKARPMNSGWARGLRDQCAAAGVPFLFKQWGEWLGGDVDSRKGKMICHPTSLEEAVGRIFWTNPGAPAVHIWGAKDHYWDVASARVGKKAAGRVLDGLIHDGFPEVEP